MATRVPAAAEVEVGTLLRDPQGDLYVVTRKDGIAYWTVELDEVVESDGEEWDEREASGGWRDNCYPQVKAGTAEPDAIGAIYERTAYREDVAEIMATVSPADHRALYNTIAAVQHWGGKLASAQQEVNDYSKSRANDLRKLVGIVGTQDKAAKLLGIDQSRISRALRDGCR